MINPAENVRAELKKRGINSRRVSVRCSCHSLDIRIKDLSVCADMVREIAQQFERIDRCEYTHEILAGGNFFVSVCYDWKAESMVKATDDFKALHNEIEAKIQAIQRDSEGADLPGGVVAFRHNMGSQLKAIVPWTDNYWDHYGSSEDLALDIFRARLQKKY